MSDYTTEPTIPSELAWLRAHDRALILALADEWDDQQVRRGSPATEWLRRKADEFGGDR